jgi:hypothetical protein
MREDAWRFYLKIDGENAEVEFVGVWEKVRYRPGQGPLDNALELAQLHPLSIREELVERRSAGYPKFVSLAGWLQVGMGVQPILLPVEKVGTILTVTPMTVSRYRQWAIEDYYLREVKAAAFEGKGRRGKAAEFVFNVGLWDLLKQRAQAGTVEVFQGLGG